MTARFSPETVMACAILTAKQAKADVLIEKVSSLFAKLREEKIEEVGKVALRRLPHGLYSEDVEAFFGHLIASGFATARSPLLVNEKGLRLCQKLIGEESSSHPEEFKKVAHAIGFDLSLINSPTAQ